MNNTIDKTIKDISCCENEYGDLKAVIVIRNYQEIMSRKIRVHLYKKALAEYGIEDDEFAEDVCGKRSMY